MSQKPPIGRRTFVKGAGAVAGLSTLGFPAVPRAQAPTVKIGVIHPVTGPLAEPGQACRTGAQMAAEEVNAAGGIKALGGARLELMRRYGVTHVLIDRRQVRAPDPSLTAALPAMAIQVAGRGSVTLYRLNHRPARLPVAGTQ